MFNSDSLKVYVFNVGAGDNIMLEFPDNSIGIIDSFYTRALNLEEPPALSYLKYIRSQKDISIPIRIAFLSISHADIDHLKGFEKIIQFIEDEGNNVIVENLWLFGGIEIKSYIGEFKNLARKVLKNIDDEQYEEFEKSKLRYVLLLKKINEFTKNWRRGNSTNYKKIRQERSESNFNDFKKLHPYGSIANNVEAYSFGPLAKFINDSDDKNVNSIISHLFEKLQNFQNKLVNLDIKYKGRINRNGISAILSLLISNYNLIFGGDATKEVIIASLEDIPIRGGNEDLAKKLFNPDFIKASHHGARTSTAPELWDKLLFSPKKNLFVAISAGSSHSHPHIEFIDDLKKCCLNKGVNLYMCTTNKCAKCLSNDLFINGDVDLIWLDGVKLSTGSDRVEHAFRREEGKKKKLGRGAILTEKTIKPNLAAYIYEFPINEANNEGIKVYRGFSKNIFTYDRCSFDPTCNC